MVSAGWWVLVPPAPGRSTRCRTTDRFLLRSTGSDEQGPLIQSHTLSYRQCCLRVLHRARVVSTRFLVLRAVGLLGFKHPLPVGVEQSRRLASRSNCTGLLIGKGGEAAAAGENTGAAVAGAPMGPRLLTTEAAHVGERGAFRVQHDCHARILDEACRSATDPCNWPSQTGSLFAVFFVDSLLADAQA
ncbi:hypothetical protein SAMN04487912_1155 [Arthrobacter sp. cf158]|nr:hypothetical protein SAMN04487912_1155 [Arthrobacter sp. cf158]